MPRFAKYDDDDEDESVWDDAPDSDADDDDDDEDYTIPCPYCRRPIHEDAPQCPYCEQYISGEDAPPSRKPWWIIAGVVICLCLIYFWVRW